VTNAPVVRRERSFPIGSDGDVVVARGAVRDWAREIGLTVVDLTKVVTASSELARNALLHGGGGTMRLEIVEHQGRAGLRATFSDEGPGIPEVDLAMQDGYTTGHGMGIGLPGAKRLVNEFALSTAPGQGTSITILRWKK
jgi:serine/threonine-protein kinase RsbT